LLSDSRSLIRPLNLPNPNRKYDGRDALPFVDRISELTTAWTALAQNAEGPLTQKLRMIIVGQMFGSGKTMFGEHLFNFNDQRIEELFNKVLETKPLVREMLHETLTVYINCQNLANHQPARLALGPWISRTIFVTTLMQCFSVDQARAEASWYDAGEPECSKCAILLHSLVLKPLFFHFDEIGALTSLFPELIDAEDPQKIYYKFWTESMPIQHAGCWMYLSGRVLYLSGVGTKAINSPGIGCNIHLALFRKEDIADIIWESDKNKPTHIGTKLMISSIEEKNEVTRWLFMMTTGIPRYVEFALYHMIVQTLEVGGFVNWPASPEHEIMKVMKEAPGFPRLVSTPEFAHLFKLAVIGRVISDDSEYRSKSLVELAAYHGFYITTVPNRSNCFKLVIPRLWSQELKLSGGHEAADLRFICQLPSADKGKIFERHVEERILFASNYPPDDAVLPASTAFPFLTGTMVANENVFGCVPKEMSKHLNLSMMENMMGQLSKSEVVLVRPIGKSSTPDLMTLLPAVQPCGKRYIIGWQMKNWPNSTLSRSLLSKEIDKFTALLPPTTVCLGGVLVVVLNGTGSPEVEKMRGEVNIIPPTKSGKVNIIPPTKSGKVNIIPPTKSGKVNIIPPTNSELGKTPPPPVEVVILKLDELNDFLGEYNLESLSKAAA
jgi:hypothetical protein